MENTLAFTITYLYKDFLAYSTGELKKLGLSFGQLPFILYIAKHPGCTQSELTKHLRMDWGHSQRSITKLVEEEFIEKKYLTGDRKSYHLYLTSTGRQAFDASHNFFDAWDKIQLKSLSEDEQQQLLSLLHRLTLSKEISKRHESL